MKATKKIVGAAVALVAAVALSAGTTFAWFAMNDSVTADGLSVKATTPTNLAIESGYQTTATAVTKNSISMIAGSKEGLKPVAISTSKPETGATIIDGSASGGAAATGGALYALDATFTEDDNKPTAGTPGTADGYTAVGEGSVATYFKWGEAGAAANTGDASLTKDSVAYVAGYNMTLANVGATVDITATVTVTWSNTDNSHTFLRTGFLIGTPDSSSTTYKFYSIANDSSSGTALTASGGEIEYEDLIKNFESNTVVTVTFLAWFDGNDADCYTNNAISTASLGIEIEYVTKSSSAD